MALKRSRVRVPLGPSKPSFHPLVQPAKGLFISVRKGMTVAKQKDNPLDNLGNRLRELLKEIEGLLTPQQPKRARALVPVPIRVPRPTSNRRSPY
jgi:hypothetical protein